MQTVKGRTAVISGGSVGMKFEMVQHLLRDGVKVALLGHHGNVTQAAVERARQVSPEIIGFECDVGDPAAVDRCLEETAQRFGGIDILMSMHGAHAQPEKSDFERMELEFWRGNIEGHITGTYLLMRQALPYLKRSSAPRIVVESAGCAADPDGSVLPFSTAKGGVEALVKGAARRLARYGITVNAISLAGVPGEGAGEEELAALRGQIPLGRCCTGADLAFAAETLICEEAGFVTGEIFHLSGGLFVN